MATTPNYQFPYPSENDVPNGAAQIGALATSLDTFLLGKLKLPAVNLKATTIQSIPNNAYTAVKFNAENIDTHGFHSTATLTERITPKVAGIYLVIAGMTWAANSTGQRRIVCGKNGSPGGQMDSKEAGAYMVSHQAVWTHTANGTSDYFSALAYQTSGGALSTVVSGSFQPTFQVIYLRPLP